MALKHDVSAVICGALKRCAPELQFAIELKDGYPEQNDVRQRIETIERGARAILQALNRSNFILDPILRGPSGDLPHEREALIMLKELVKRVSAFKNQNPPRPGRHKLSRVAGEPDARKLCALIVGLHLEKVDDGWPGQRSQKADQLCEALWRFAGGDAHVVNLSEPYWRRDLRDARHFRPPHPAGERILQLLTEKATSRVVSCRWPRV